MEVTFKKITLMYYKNVFGNLYSIIILFQFPSSATYQHISDPLQVNKIRSKQYLFDTI